MCVCVYCFWPRAVCAIAAVSAAFAANENFLHIKCRLCVARQTCEPVLRPCGSVAQRSFGQPRAAAAAAYCQIHPKSSDGPLFRLNVFVCVH